ncbi:MAG: translation initiation factor 2 [Caulobacteraceae bacterium]|nr:translation initiation factor 2 [Caulobacteraceae bacterium]
MTRGTTQQFTIESTPPAAKARTSSGFSCESTPCTIRMPRKDAFTVTVSKPGYKTSVTDVKPKIASNGAAGFLGNALIGGVIGAAVDVGSGATLDLSPNPLHIDLVAEGADPVGPAAPAAAATPAAAPAPAPTPSATATPASATPAASTVAALAPSGAK